MLPFDRAHPLQVPPLLCALQRRGPIHRVRTRAGDEAWLVTGYAEVRQLLGDDRFGMSHPDPDHAARANNSALFGGRPLDNYKTEDADRDRFRSLLAPYFSAKAMRALRPRVEELVTGLLGHLEAQGPPADLHEALAVPLPVLVICELLGVPPTDRTQFRAQTQAASAVTDPDRSAAGLAELWAYTRGLVDDKRLRPDDRVIAGLCRAEGGTLDPDYIATLAAMILFAGHETTVVQIGSAVALLLGDPDLHFAELSDPKVAGTAVEECLRAANFGGEGIPRYARTDLEISGVPVGAGELVLLDPGAANHDGAVFAAPHRLELDRKIGMHLSFGHGPHYCIGAPLARIEIHTALCQLATRFPTLSLAVPTDQLRWRSDLLAGGFAEVPVTW
jgi:pentalenolactone synthase